LTKLTERLWFEYC